ncbi:MAG TPA: hydrogenase expression/formation protein HypE [Anaerolineaceae bacterium]|jgi:hydrogenase expression/formation protein HypE|nr:hydrogenase expression/formation protein HypE [Chloroflexota bacterium]HNZ16548.1 hydrogenase expression/formation protein HypE [Anaerolineaceae bacterium]
MIQPEMPIMEGPNCPLPISERGHIVIGHGSGGQMTHDLVRDVFQKRLANTILNAANDAASIPATPPGKRLVVSTDAHIVSPLFFAGGDIGRLAVCGTVNDVAMLGAEPRYLTATFILEEGFSIEELERIVDSFAEACREAGVELVAADTKVTEKGKSDKLFISTTGIGWVESALQIGGEQAMPGDAVIISGPVGNHGIAVAEARGNLGFSSQVCSDTAPLNHMVKVLLDADLDVHVLRDPTRGGLATTLVEIVRQSQISIELDEENIPIDKPVRKTCELLGLDPLYLANEGKLIVILPAEQAPAALRVLRGQKYGEGACVIGRVYESSRNQLWLKTAFGTTRVLEMLAGEMLPRIC